jgi:DNA-binding NarL/FixJ family response regulator
VKKRYPQRNPAKGRNRPESSYSPEPQQDAAEQEPYRILIVDDHSVVRRGLRAILDSQPGIEVCGEAGTGRQAIEVVKELKPDLVVLDLTPPEKNGLEVTQEVRANFPETHVLVLTMHFSEEVAREVLRSGAIGYVLKSDADDELLAAVDHARHRQPFFTSKLAVTMAHNFVMGQRETPDPAGKQGEGAVSPLTPRETEVVRLLAEGSSNKQVASRLGVSTRTIESHRNHIMHKMDFGSFSDLVRFAVRNNLIEP